MDADNRDIIDRGIDLLARKLRIRDELGDAEIAALRGAVSSIRRVDAGRVSVRSGVPLTESNLLVDGIAARYKDLADGQRQIMEVHVGGDFIDLHSFLLGRLEHNIGALSDITLLIVPHDNLRAITEQHPHLARMLWLSTLLDAAMHRERILTLGRRSAVSRLAHLFCELQVRLELIGLAEEDGYKLPIVQADLADAAGLTAVHVNRMLKELRDRGLVTFRGSRVTIHDRAGLCAVAEFDPSYLFLDHHPR